MSDLPGTDETFAAVLNGLTKGGRRRPAAGSTVDGEAGAGPSGYAGYGGYDGYDGYDDWDNADDGTGTGTGAEPTADLAGHTAQPVAGRSLDIERLAADAGITSDAAIVRPYSWTGGRTRSKVELRIEALVTTSGRAEDVDSLRHSEHRAVAALCREPRSVAEVATLMSVPLGVAKVLLGDMANLGLVVVHRTAGDGGNKAHLLLMERVLSGLRRL